MQSLVVVLIVVAAVAYVSRRVWQTVVKARRAKTAGACGDGCCK